ncbi:sphingosine kinase 1-like isoform X1 [Iris pallida]|uniref:sphingosine kinase n=1 Tax=Iris pallida TaxID=29817 RepID=A0AAX6GL00_IRIPA|nr:sphingosine kinase 1-like isoform X1 [Iris pallida]KAJ6829334.1 sphingosine kinase 1-like isoform X1 [Iris pallida]
MAGQTLTLPLAGRIRINGSPSDASLAADGRLTWRVEGEAAGEMSLDLDSDILGFGIEQGRKIRVRSFPEDAKAASCGGCRETGAGRSRVRKDFVLEMPTEESAAAWSDRLKNCLDSLGRPKRLLLILNPYGGKKRALKIFHSEVKPLLVAADIQYTLQETKYQLHAQQIAHKLDLLKYDGIVCVSGDGILVEVVNGLLQRDDWDTAIKMPLGIIPAGTGNGMAKSLLDAAGQMYSVSHAAFSVIRGHKRSLDVTTVIQGEKRFFSVLMLTWGLVADIDIESEKYRWLGSARLDFYSLLRLVKLRRYHGHVQFVPAPGYEMYGDPIQHGGDFKEDRGISKQKAQRSQGGYEGASCSESWEWRSLDGPFISVWLNNVPWAGVKFMPAPEAKFSDGYLDVVLVQDCPKAALISLLTKMADGTHIKSPHVMYFKVKAFKLEPGQRVGNPKKGGIIDSDGEVLARGEGTYQYHQKEDLMAYGPIQMTLDNGLATIFTPR